MKKKHKKKPAKKPYRCIYKHNHKEPDLEYEFDNTIHPTSPIKSKKEQFDIFLYDVAMRFLVFTCSMSLMAFLAFLISLYKT